MRTWWVNQNRTFRHEVGGGYLWSPKLRRDRTRNPYYETMREVAPGDLVFSFAQTRIQAIGRARSYAYECPKPVEFAHAGRDWDDVGWRVDVAYEEPSHRVRPSDWMHVLAPLLPRKYAPLLADGRGVQSVYLTELEPAFAQALASLVGLELGERASLLAVGEIDLGESEPELLLWEEHLRREIERDPGVSETDREALVIARRGQGLFRSQVQSHERFCRVTRVTNPEHLRASHCKPWRDSTNEERLDGENGLLLTPSIDHLFDRGFLSFDDDGLLLVSPVADRTSLRRMGVEVGRELQTGPFTEGQRKHLEYHRDAVFLMRHRAS